VAIRLPTKRFIRGSSAISSVRREQEQTEQTIEDKIRSVEEKLN
jgi:hypothetical protein